MTYQEILTYLDSFINYEKTLPRKYARVFKLERMNRLLDLLGNPHRGLKTIHITGTKGKGSTACLIASVLEESNLTVGLYTSPHLASFCERIRINSKMIDEGSLCRIVTEIKPYLESMRRDGISFFEVYTAIAFLYFFREKIDIAVIEVGLGGRLDATNVLNSSVSVITPISYEHTVILGSTLKDIAVEKVGIIKDGSVCISAPQEKEALSVIEETCLRKKVPFYLVGRDITIKEKFYAQDVQCFDVKTTNNEYADFELKLRGRHQIINAAVAIGAVEALRMYGLNIDKDIIRRGIQKAEWPGRMEVIHDKPKIVLDGAQNVASAKVLVEAIRRHFNYKRLILILGISKDKDIRGIWEILSDIADFVILTRADNPRAMEPKRLAEVVGNRPKEEFLHSQDALESALAKAEKDDLILVTGSLFLVGQIREKLKAQNSIFKTTTQDLKLKVQSGGLKF